MSAQNAPRTSVWNKCLEHVFGWTVQGPPPGAGPGRPDPVTLSVTCPAGVSAGQVRLAYGLPSALMALITSHCGGMGLTPRIAPDAAGQGL